jgi:hypothetical protein
VNIPQVDIPELPESKSADEEETSVSDNLGLSEPAIAHHFDPADGTDIVDGTDIADGTEVADDTDIADGTDIADDTDIADVAVVKDVSEVEAQVVGPKEEEPAKTLEAPAEVDAPSHITESKDVKYELEEVSEIPKFVVDELTEVRLTLTTLGTS